MNYLILTQDKVAIVDDEDFDWAFQWKWYAHLTRSGFYAKRKDYSSGRQKTIQLHREILARKLGRPLEPGEETDHINGDTLDNRRANLRLATHAQNGRNRTKKNKNNTSGYMGVDWHKTKWRAHIQVNGKDIHLGYFHDLVEAARVYDEAALKYHGRFASINGV